MGGYGRYGSWGWEPRDARQVKKVSELPGYEVALNALVQLLAEYVVEFMGPKWVEQVNAKAKEDLLKQHLPLALSVKEAAKLISVAPSRIYEGVRRNEIPSIRMGSRILIPTHKLMELLGSETTSPEASR
jgi:excisionase family DNA binding protein